MQKRFIIKQVKIVWRNSMIAGNPITRSFKKFGIYDRNWQEDRYCHCPRPCGEWATNNGQHRKYRLVVDNEDFAKTIAERMNSLLQSIPNVRCIDFNGISSWIKDANDITIKKVECN